MTSLLFMVFAILITLLGFGRGSILSIIITVFVIILYIYNKKEFNSSILFYALFGGIIVFYSFDYLSGFFLYKHLGAESLTDLWSITQDTKSLMPRLLRWEILISYFEKDPIMAGGFSRPILSRVNEGFRAWGAHNYFLSILGGGGLFLLIPTVLFYGKVLKKVFSIFVFDKMHSFNSYFGIGLILITININISNTYFIQVWSGASIWILFGFGLYLIFEGKYKTPPKDTKKIKRVSLLKR